MRLIWKDVNFDRLAESALSNRFAGSLSAFLERLYKLFMTIIRAGASLMLYMPIDEQNVPAHPDGEQENATLREAKPDVFPRWLLSSSSTCGKGLLALEVGQAAPRRGLAPSVKRAARVSQPALIHPWRNREKLD